MATSVDEISLPLSRVVSLNRKLKLEVKALTTVSGIERQVASFTSTEAVDNTVDMVIQLNPGEQWATTEKVKTVAISTDSPVLVSGTVGADTTAILVRRLLVLDEEFDSLVIENLDTLEVANVNIVYGSVKEQS